MGRPPSSSTSATPSTGRGRILCTFTIDCSKVVEDHVLDVAAFKKFLQEQMKIIVSRVFKEDKTMRKIVKKPQNLGDYITVSREESKIIITGDSRRLNKRYLKFTTKKFLKKNKNRDWRRVIASDEDPNAYVVQYFNAPTNRENKNAHKDSAEKAAENGEKKKVAENGEKKNAAENEEKKKAAENGKKKNKKKKKKKTEAKC